MIKKAKPWKSIHEHDYPDSYFDEKDIITERNSIADELNNLRAELGVYLVLGNRRDLDNFLISYEELVKELRS